MTIDNPQTPQEWLIHLKERTGRSFAWMSKQAGHDHAYISQFLTRGTPRKLGEDERAKLAAALGVNEKVFREPETAAVVNDALVNGLSQSDSADNLTQEASDTMVHDMVSGHERRLNDHAERLRELEQRLLDIERVRGTRSNPRKRGT